MYIILKKIYKIKNFNASEVPKPNSKALNLHNFTIFKIIQIMQLLLKII